MEGSLRVGCGRTDRLHRSSDRRHRAVKPVMLPPGRGKLATKPLPTGSATVAKTIGMVRVCCSSAVVGCGVRKNEVGLQRDEFFRELPHQVRFSGRRPASVNPNVAALRPPELLESVPECRDIALCLRVAFGKAHQHTDPPDGVGLLRAHRKRPRRRRAAKRYNELSSSDVDCHVTSRGEVVYRADDITL